MATNLYMVIEHFRNGDAVPVYRRFRDLGRLAPAGLSYVSSWSDTKLERWCQLMETDNPLLLAVPHTRADLKPRRTVDQMVSTITDLSKSARNTNTTSYIVDANHEEHVCRAREWRCWVVESRG